MMWVDRDPHHGGRRGARDRADRRQADAGLLLGGAHRLPAHRRARRPERHRARRRPDHLAPGGAVLPGRPTASRRSAPSRSSRWSATPAARRPTCPAGPGSARSRRWWRASSRSSCSRWPGIPLTVGLHRQVGGLRGRRCRPAPGRSCVVAVLTQRRGGVLLRPRDRADVLLRARRATAPSVAQPVGADRRHHRGRRRRHPGARHRARPGARPGGPCGRIHQVSTSPAPAGLALPVTDERPRRPPPASGWRRSRTRSPATSAAGRRSSPRRPATCWTPAASGSGRCWCCSPPRPVTHPDSDDVVDRRLRRRADPPRLALPRRRDGRGRAAPRRRLGQRPLGQPRRDPHRRLPVREVVRADRRARPRRRADPGRRRSPGWSRARSSRRSQPGAGEDPLAALPRRRRRQDRLADRHLGALRRPLRRRDPRGRGGAHGVRRDRRLRLPALRRHPRHRLRHRTSPARPPAPTCARACRPCRC